MPGMPGLLPVAEDGPCKVGRKQSLGRWAWLVVESCSVYNLHQNLIDQIIVIVFGA